MNESKRSKLEQVVIEWEKRRKREKSHYYENKFNVINSILDSAKEFSRIDIEMFKTIDSKVFLIKDIYSDEILKEVDFWQSDLEYLIDEMLSYAKRNNLLKHNNEVNFKRDGIVYNVFYYSGQGIIEGIKIANEEEVESFSVFNFEDFIEDNQIFKLDAKKLVDAIRDFLCKENLPKDLKVSSEQLLNKISQYNQ